MHIVEPFWIALQFLTRLPVRLARAPSERAIGRSLLYYPLVGLLLGLLLAATAAVLAGLPALLRAALVLVAWVAVTGALHLDGLADSVDAWVGGRGDRDRTLRIMKDPACGPMGVAALVCVLLVKFAALDAALNSRDWMLLVLAPLLARTLLPVLFLTTAYVRPGGLGASMADHLPRHATGWVVLGSACAVLVCAGWRGVVLMAIAATVLVLMRTLMLRRIQGTTGDTAGALVELAEVAMLVCGISCGNHTT